MARLARVVAVDVPHHVTQRANARQFILNSGPERMVYMDLLRQAVQLHPLVSEKGGKRPVCPRFSFAVSWVPGWITATVTYADGSTRPLVHPGDMAVSGSGGVSSVDSQKVGKFTVRQLAGVLFNEYRDLAFVGPSQPGEDPLENAKTAEANAIYNNASRKKPHTMATPKVSKKLQKTAQYRQDLEIMRAVYTSRTSGGSDPAAGRTYFGNSAQQLNSRPIGGSRQTVFGRFGPFAFGSNPPEYIYIYNDPK